MTHVAEFVALGLLFCLAYIIGVHLFFLERDSKYHDRRFSAAAVESADSWRKKEKETEADFRADFEIGEEGGKYRDEKHRS